VVRILAPASGYPISRYITAQIIGRLPRFYVLAWLGAAIEFPTWFLVSVFVATVGMFWLTSRSRGELEAPAPGDHS
jgi:uncharacterized membrane protein YdjX (TVP38/TMEM64 family)